mmetsp:Transcript_6913/g.6070  ORF Transcript_6913/g.6070 Transcript_6913/m.6070 type:complete len:209 (-) Transcript_6913:37-663(-)
MVDWEETFRKWMTEPLLLPLFSAYGKFMELERGSKFPFYINPSVKNVDEKENTILDFVDNLVDIHELERNKHDKGRIFYERLYYTVTNFHRLTNDTMVNLTFDTQLPKYQYDKLNNAIEVRYLTYLASMTSLHTMTFASLCYFFRYRRISVLPCAILSVLYANYFSLSNKIGYKIIVDSKVNSLARSFDKEGLVQPVGTYTPKGLNHL